MQELTVWKEKLKDRDLRNFYHLETEEKAVNAIIAGTNICLKGGEGERYDLLHCSFFDVSGGRMQDGKLSGKKATNSANK